MVTFFNCIEILKIIYLFKWFLIIFYIQFVERHKISNGAINIKIQYITFYINNLLYTLNN